MLRNATSIIRYHEFRFLSNVSRFFTLIHHVLRRVFARSPAIFTKIFRILREGRDIIRARDVITLGHGMFPKRGLGKGDQAGLFDAAILQEDASRRKCAV